MFGARSNDLAHWSLLGAVRKGRIGREGREMWIVALLILVQPTFQTGG